MAGGKVRQKARLPGFTGYVSSYRSSHTVGLAVVRRVWLFFACMNPSLLTTPLGRLRVVAFLEGVSFLVLLLVAMPLKYLAGQTDAVRYVGMAHGLLFVLYALLVLQNAIESSWSWRKAGLALLASLVPLGTFWADKRLFRE